MIIIVIIALCWITRPRLLMIDWRQSISYFPNNNSCRYAYMICCNLTDGWVDPPELIPGAPCYCISWCCFWYIFQNCSAKQELTVSTSHILIIDFSLKPYKGFSCFCICRSSLWMAAVFKSHNVVFKSHNVDHSISTIYKTLFLFKLNTFLITFWRLLISTLFNMCNACLAERLLFVSGHVPG